MISSVKDLNIDVKLFIDLVVSIGEMFPFNKPKILQIILKMIPHSALNVQVHSVFVRVLFYILERMPYYEEEILEAVLTRFMQIDVTIKSKQLANKRHFTSQDLKADIYLFYLIQHFKFRHQTMKEDRIHSLKKVDPTNSEDAEMSDDLSAESDDDSMFEINEEDMLIRLFENTVLPYSESHYPQYCFLYV